VWLALWSSRGVQQLTEQNYREDGTTPYFIFWKDGLKEVSRSGQHIARCQLTDNTDQDLDVAACHTSLSSHGLFFTRCICTALHSGLWADQQGLKSRIM
jgi:hypothetical protein